MYIYTHIHIHIYIYIYIYIFRAIAVCSLSKASVMVNCHLRPHGKSVPPQVCEDVSSVLEKKPPSSSPNPEPFT